MGARGHTHCQHLHAKHELPSYDSFPTAPLWLAGPREPEYANKLHHIRNISSGSWTCTRQRRQEEDVDA